MRWQWQHMLGARAHRSKHDTRTNISVFCLHIWSSIRSRTINGFNKYVFGFYSHKKVWYKSEKALGMCSECHYTTGDWGMETWQIALGARCHVSIRQTPSLCNAILNTCPCLLAICSHAFDIIAIVNHAPGWPPLFVMLAVTILWQNGRHCIYKESDRLTDLSLLNTHQHS